MTRVLLTGASGSFGRYLAAELLERDCELVVLVRKRDVDLPGVTVVRGDVAGRLPDLPPVDIVVHSAATTDFGLSLADARATNVEGTRTMLRLARRMPHLEKFAHISTAFVAGRRRGLMLETELRHDAGFVNAYEQSKYEAEQLTRVAARELPVVNVRPSVVVEPRGGRSALWFALGLIERGLLPALPGAPHNPLDIVPAKDAARAAADLILEPGVLGTFHVASGPRAPRIADVVRTGTGRTVRFVEEHRFPVELARLHEKNPGAARSYDALATFVRALAYPKRFDTTLAEYALGRRPCEVDPLDALVADAAMLAVAGR